MSETTDAPTPETGQPTEGQAPAKPQTLEELLSDLDEDRRTVILEQVGKARGEAKNLRERLKQAEPKVAEYDRLAAASKTAEERAQEAQQAAEQRATTAVQRVVRAEVKAALTGVVDDPNALIEDLNLSKFVDADGEIDENAIAALKVKYQSLGGRRAPRPDPSQASGANGAAQAAPGDVFASFLQGQIGSARS